MVTKELEKILRKVVEVEHVVKYATHDGTRTGMQDLLMRHKHTTYGEISVIKHDIQKLINQIETECKHTTKPTKDEYGDSYDICTKCGVDVELL